MRLTACFVTVFLFILSYFSYSQDIPAPTEYRFTPALKDRIAYTEYLRYRIRKSGDYDKFILISAITNAFYRYPPDDYSTPFEQINIIEKKFHDELKAKPYISGTVEKLNLLIDVIGKYTPKKLKWAAAAIVALKELAKDLGKLYDANSEEVNKRKVDRRNLEGFYMYQEGGDQMINALYDLIGDPNSPKYNRYASIAFNDYLNNFLNGVKSNMNANQIFSKDVEFEKYFKLSGTYDLLQALSMKSDMSQKYLIEMRTLLKQQSAYMRMMNSKLDYLTGYVNYQQRKQRIENEYRRKLAEDQLKIDAARAGTYLIYTILSFGGSTKSKNLATNFYATANFVINLSVLFNNYSASEIEGGLNQTLSGIKFTGDFTSIGLSFINSLSGGGSFETEIMEQINEVRRDIFELREAMFLCFERLDERLVQIHNNIEERFNEMFLRLADINKGVAEIKNELSFIKSDLMKIQNQISDLYVSVNAGLLSVTDVNLKSTLNILDKYDKGGAKLDKATFEKLENDLYTWAVDLCVDELHAGSDAEVINYDNFNTITQKPVDQIITPLFKFYNHTYSSNGKKIVPEFRVPNPTYWLIAADAYITLLEKGKTFAEANAAIYKKRLKQVIQNGVLIDSALTSIAYKKNGSKLMTNNKFLRDFLLDHKEKLEKLYREIKNIETDFVDKTINDIANGFDPKKLEKDIVVRTIQPPYVLMDSINYVGVTPDASKINLKGFIDAELQRRYNAASKFLIPCPANLLADDTIKLAFALQHYSGEELVYTPVSLTYGRFGSFAPTELIGANSECPQQGNQTFAVNADYIKYEYQPLLHYRVDLRDKSGSYTPVSYKIFRSDLYKDSMILWQSPCYFTKYKQSFENWDIYNVFLSKNLLSQVVSKSQEYQFSPYGRSSLYLSLKQQLIDSFLRVNINREIFSQANDRATELYSILHELSVDKEVLKMFFTLGYNNLLYSNDDVYAMVYSNDGFVRNILINDEIFNTQLLKSTFDYARLFDTIYIKQHQLKRVQTVLGKYFADDSLAYHDVASAAALLKRVPLFELFNKYPEIFPFPKKDLLAFSAAVKKVEFIPESILSYTLDDEGFHIVMDDTDEGLVEEVGSSKFVESNYFIKETINRLRSAIIKL